MLHTHRMNTTEFTALEWCDSESKSLFSLLKSSLFRLYGRHVQIVPPFLSLNNVCDAFQLSSGSLNICVWLVNVLTYVCVCIYVCVCVFYCCNHSLYSQHFLCEGHLFGSCHTVFSYGTSFRLRTPSVLLVKRNLAVKWTMSISKIKHRFFD